MKKFSALILALIMVLAGCGGSGSSVSSAASSGAQPAPSAAAKFPTDQITVICPFSAGGASDTTSRVFAAELQKVLGVSVIVENRTGANGAIGLESGASATPDGYTVTYLPWEASVLHALGYTDLVSSDAYALLGRAMTIPAAITVRANSEWKTLEDFVNAAKAKPNTITVGNSGAGGVWHLSAAMFEKSAGIDITPVPYTDGASAAIASLMGKELDAVSVSAAEVKTYVDAGDLRVLCVLSDVRDSNFPDVPTAKELGYEVTVQGWGAFGVPAATPEDVLATLRDAARQAINSSSMTDLLNSKAFQPSYLDGDAASAELDDMETKFSALIKELDIAQK